MLIAFNYLLGIMLGPLVKRLKSVLQVEETVDKRVVKIVSDTDSDGAGTKLTELKESVYDCIKTIRDPEKPASLEDLNVVYEEGVSCEWDPLRRNYTAHIEYNPTVPHCSLATLIGLCIRIKLERHVLPVDRLKIFVRLKRGSHDTEEEINKQINDKERVAAAIENPSLADLVDKCIKDSD